MIGTSSALLISGIALQVYGYYSLKEIIPIRFSDIFRILAPPVLLTLIMIIFIYILRHQFDTINILHLVVLILFGFVIYLGGHIILATISKSHHVFTYFKEVLKGIR